LAAPPVVVVQDQNGNPVPNQTVAFTPSPGGLILPQSVITDANGKASANWRLALIEGVELATASVGKSVATFSAPPKAFSLTNSPGRAQNVDGTLGNGSDTIRQKGGLLAAAASILRYRQQRGEMPQPNGLADVATLNSFLKALNDGFISFGGTE